MSTETLTIDISLTDFVDFVCKAGSAKLNFVKMIKNRKPYSPVTDFYKALREGIINNQKANADKNNLSEILKTLTDPKKQSNYKEAIEGYKKFIGKKSIIWFDPPFKHWRVGELDVRVNPELGLCYNDTNYVVKLFFKKDKLSKDKIYQILTLMESQLINASSNKLRMAILDVKNGKLFAKDNDDISMLPLLDGEAKSFQVIWHGV